MGRRTAVAKGCVFPVRRSPRISAKVRRSACYSSSSSSAGDESFPATEQSKFSKEEKEVVGFNMQAGLPEATSLYFKPIQEIYEAACTEYPALREIFDIVKFKALARKIGGKTALLLEPPLIKVGNGGRDEADSEIESDRRFEKLAEEFLDAQEVLFPMDDEEDPEYPPGFAPLSLVPAPVVSPVMEGTVKCRGEVEREPEGAWCVVDQPVNGSCQKSWPATPEMQKGLTGAVEDLLHKTGKNILIPMGDVIDMPSISFSIIICEQLFGPELFVKPIEKSPISALSGDGEKTSLPPFNLQYTMQSKP